MISFKHHLFINLYLYLIKLFLKRTEMCSRKINKTEIALTRPLIKLIGAYRKSLKTNRFSTRNALKGKLALTVHCIGQILPYFAVN